MSKYLSFVTGAALGILVGGVFSLLLTPYSGEQLRREARRAADARREQLEKRLADLRSPEPPASS
ncbi:MAG: YtxH domain-containing protein [Anaerolineales bacterium]|jgi:gas vesicle protein